jgi:antitoxin YefM
MTIASISEFKKNLKKYLNKVTENFETLIIYKGKDSGIVIISLDKYNSLQTTQHELSSKVNASRLDAAIEKFNNGSKKY